MNATQAVWLTLLAMVAIPLLLAIWLRVYPRRPMAYCMVGAFAVSFGVLLHPAFLVIAFLVDVLLLGVVTADLMLLVHRFALPADRRGTLETILWLAIGGAVSASMTLLMSDDTPLLAKIAMYGGPAMIGMLLAFIDRRTGLAAVRYAPRVASLGKRSRITLELQNESRRTIEVDIRDDLDETMHPEPANFERAFVPPRSKLTLEYTIRPTQRGAFQFEKVFVDALSPVRLWRRIVECPCETKINVYPDLQQIGEYALMARTNRLSQMGVRRIRRVGQDHDFERLRDYTPDDNYRHIDWRATARRQKLTVKDFQSSRSQRVIFLVDCGRMMTNEAAGISLLDHSLNAMLMLSYVALSQSDAVGLICFSNRVHGYVPPKTGMNQMTRLLHACFDRFPNLVESRYDEAFQYLATHCRKRSLVILISNVIDEVNSGQIEQYMTNLVGRHLPLGVLLRDRRIYETLDRPLQFGNNVWEAGAAAEILAWRLQVIADLQSRGALALDVFPEEMTAPLINEYLEIKARHLL